MNRFTLCSVALLSVFGLRCGTKTSSSGVSPRAASSLHTPESANGVGDEAVLRSIVARSAPAAKVEKVVVRGRRAVVVLAENDAISFHTFEYWYEHREASGVVPADWVAVGETYPAPLEALRASSGSVSEDAVLLEWIEGQIAPDQQRLRVDLMVTDPDDLTTRQTLFLAPLRPAPSGSLACVDGTRFASSSRAIGFIVELAVCRGRDGALTGLLRVVDDAPQTAVKTALGGPFERVLRDDDLSLTSTARGPNHGGFARVGDVRFVGASLELQQRTGVASFSGSGSIRVEADGALALEESSNN